MKNKIAKIMIFIIGVVFISQGGMALEPKIVIKTVESVSKAFDKYEFCKTCEKDELLSNMPADLVKDDIIGKQTCGFLATYNDGFFCKNNDFYHKDDGSERYNFFWKRAYKKCLSWTRVAIMPYDHNYNFKEHTQPQSASPWYVIELEDTAINLVPKSVITAICEGYNERYKNKLDEKKDILIECKNAGIENIYITACGYCCNEEKECYSQFHVLPETGEIVSNKDCPYINVELGFNGIMSIRDYYDYQSCGIIDQVNVKINCFSPLGDGKLSSCKLYGDVPDFPTIQMEKNKICQFYVVAMPNRKTIIINQVILAHEPVMTEIRKRLIEAPTLDKGLEEIRNVVKDLNLDNPIDNKSAIRRLTELIQPVLNVKTKN